MTNGINVTCSGETGNKTVISDIRLVSDSVHTNSDNQLDQYFQFVKDMLLEKKFISEQLICSAYNQNYHSCSQHNNCIHCSFVLSGTSQMSLATLSLLRQSRSHYARAGHITPVQVTFCFFTLALPGYLEKV